MFMDKRIISLGVLYPEPIHNEIIYVNVKRDSEGGELSAEAFSVTSFKYKGKKVKRVNNCENYSKHTGNPIYSSYFDFLKRLKKENNAEVKQNRLFEDALDCRSLLENITFDANRRLKIK